MTKTISILALFIVSLLMPKAELMAHSELLKTNQVNSKGASSATEHCLEMEQNSSTSNAPSISERSLTSKHEAENADCCEDCQCPMLHCLSFISLSEMILPVMPNVNDSIANLKLAKPSIIVFSFYKPPILA